MMAQSMEATVSTSTLDNDTPESNKSCIATNNIQVQPTINGGISSSCTSRASSCNGISAYSDNSVVWVRLGQSWWPGTIVALERCPHDFVRDLKKTPLAVVKFFEEQGFVDIHKSEHIYPYNCERKKEFIKKGLNLKSIQNKEELFKKFESDVLMAQSLTGGSSDVFTQIEEDSNKRRIDYSNLGFGPPKPKKKKEEACRLGSDITEAVHYKKDAEEGCATLTAKKMKLEHKVVIMEQPHVENMKEDLRKSCTSYTCHICDFSCSRLGVIVWHNKGHLKTVMDYDTGIRIPGRRKRKARAPKHKAKLQKLDKEAVVDHAKTNGHLEQNAGSSLEAKRLLLDWEDEDEENNGDNTEASIDSGVRVSKEQRVNGFGNNAQGPDAQSEEPDDNDGAYCRSRENRSKRLPMRHPDDLNSAFDALLADTPSSGNMASSSYIADESSYTNNDSDSDASNWEKYYDKDSDNEDDQEAKESDIKSLCEGSDRDESDDIVSSTVTNGAFLDEEEHDLSNKEEDAKHFSGENAKEDGDNTIDSASYSPEPSNQTDEVDNETNEMDDVDEEDGEHDNEKGEGDDDTNDDEHAGGDETNESDAKEENGARSSLSSSPSNSCPAFMLVAVDAHGKNVPMPALTDPNHSSNLVAVEASMEDGTSRTLYIDPAYLEPNVDLSNLMLHIDNSGQETVIIPSTTGQDTPANATPPRDSTSSSNSSSSSSSSRHSSHVPTQVAQHSGGATATNLTEVTSSNGASMGIEDGEEEEIVYDGHESSYIYAEKDQDVPSPIEGQQEAVIVSTNTEEGTMPMPHVLMGGW